MGYFWEPVHFFAESENEWNVIAVRELNWCKVMDFSYNIVIGTVYQGSPNLCSIRKNLVFD